MKQRIRGRQVRFYHEDGCLVRTTTGGDGRTYTHRCTQAAFEAVAHAIDETPDEGQGTTMPIIACQEGLPYSQVNVAMEFLVERGIIDRRHRRNYPATVSVHLDAKVEWYALAEE